MSARTLQVHPEDWRPPDQLHRRGVDPMAVIMGVAVAVGVHGLLALALALRAILAALGFLTLEIEAAQVSERNVVEARFARLGVDMQNKLPNRRVPRLSTAPPEAQEAYAKTKSATRRERPDAGPRPENPTEDLLTRLGDRAQVFAEIAEEREQEGNPEGIEEGTEENARAGDLYAGQLYVFFRRGWTVPTTISDEERRGLTAEVDVEITGDRQIADYRIRGSSGNALFDQSVLDRLQALKDSNAQVPEPPPEVASEYLGRTIGLRFRGRDAR
jgi:outer membrane biosynthesis protein TonB